MPLSNAPIEYEYKELPEGWAKKIPNPDSYSKFTVVTYNTPKYKGVIRWSWNECYGDLASRFEFNGKELYACDGECLYKSLNIPEDYCNRTGAEGWDKMLTKEYFEMWLQKP